MFLFLKNSKQVAYLKVLNVVMVSVETCAGNG